MVVVAALETLFKLIFFAFPRLLSQPISFQLLVELQNRSGVFLYYFFLDNKQLLLVVAAHWFNLVMTGMAGFVMLLPAVCCICVIL